MKENIIRICMVCGLLMILVAQFALSSLASTDNLSNDMLAWGFRRGQNNNQPDLDIRKFRSFKKI